MNRSELTTAEPAIAESDRLSSSDQFVGRITLAVRRATGGRIHNLAVRMTGTHVVLEGFCSSFHCFQLAQNAAMSLSEDLPVDNQIEVL